MVNVLSFQHYCSTHTSYFVSIDRYIKLYIITNYIELSYYDNKHIFVNVVFPLNDSVVFDFKMIETDQRVKKNMMI